MRSTVEIAQALAKLRNGEKQLRFATARALTRTAKAAQEELTAALPQIFDRPTPFTRRALAISPAKTADLVAEVFVKDIQAGYLALEETGGTRRPEPGKPVVLPVGIRTNVFGNIARGRIAAEKAKPATFVSRRDTAKTRHLPPGIYQRAKRGTLRAGGRGTKTALNLLVALERQAEYRPRFGMRKRVTATVRRVFPALFGASVADALRR